MERLSARKYLRMLVAVTAMGVVLTSCTNAPDPDASTSSSTRAITASYPGQISSLDPVGSTYGQANQVLSTVYDPLMTFDAENNLTGWLVSSYTYSDDVTSVEITLHDGVTFHDGAKLTAEDVKYSLDRYAAIGSGVAVRLKSYESSEVTGPLELTITLNKPDSLFVANLSKVYVMNSAVVKQHEGGDQAQGWLSEHDAGSGPFALTNGKEAENITVEQFAEYWRFDPDRPEKIEFRRIDLYPTQAQEVAAGAVDITSAGLDFQSAQTLKGAEGSSLVELSPYIQTYIFFNMVDGPTTNITVRKAIQLAFDYEGAMANLQHDLGVIAEGVLPVGMPCAPAQSPYKQDLKQAKALLAEAGISDLTLTLRYQNTLTYPELSTLMQANLTEIGITLDIQPITFPEYLTALSDPTKIPQMMMLDDSPAFPDPGAMLQNYHSEAIGSNRSGISDPAIDQLLDEISRTTDSTQRCELYEQVQTIIRASAVSVNLFTNSKLYAARSGIEDVAINRTSGSTVALSEIRVR